MIDLEEGVAAIFEEAATQGMRDWHDEEGSYCRGLRMDNAVVSMHNWRARTRVRQRLQAKQDKIVEKAKRAARPTYAIVAASIQSVTCPTCGRPGEIREGAEGRVQHRGLIARSSCYPGRPIAREPKTANDNGDRFDGKTSVGVQHDAVSEMSVSLL